MNPHVCLLFLLERHQRSGKQAHDERAATLSDLSRAATELYISGGPSLMPGATKGEKEVVWGSMALDGQVQQNVGPS